MASGYERDVLAREVETRALDVKAKAAALPPSPQATDVNAAIEMLIASVAQLKLAV